MPGRYFVLILGILLAIAGCDRHAYVDPEFGAPVHDEYVVIDGGDVEIAGTQDGYLYLANAQKVPYFLDSGDKVRVDVFGQENLSRIYSVDGGGYISIPLIGTVRARGTTTYGLAGRIAGALRANYLKDPKVTVEVSTYRPFFILGEVKSPGRYSYVNGMTVRTAVAIAGGYTPRASERYVNITRSIDGEPVTMEVPFTYPVKPGDTIYVTERFL